MVYDEEWDVLIVLDACRVDLLQSVVEEYEFLTGFETVESAGSSSIEWLRENFSEEYTDEMADTAHVTANVKTGQVLDVNDFLVLDEVWRYGWDHEAGTVPPRAVTDRAVATWRERSPERIVVHYMQPHFPSLAAPELGSRTVRDSTGGRWETTSIWNQLRRGTVPREAVWDAYRENLRIALDDVRLLLNSIDAETVVITSDHGNAMGEFGFYDHPGYHPLSVLRRVPWCTTDASNDSAYRPELERGGADLSEDDIRKRLDDLGYA